MKWTVTNSTLTVDTGREGALAAKGHNLRFTFHSYEISYDAESREMIAVIETDSLAYVGVIEGSGEVDSEGLSRSDQEKVVKTALDKILQVKKYPNARFEANIPDIRQKDAVSGKLTLCGTTAPVTFIADVDGDCVTTSFKLLQSDFHIKQYSAFLGALKVTDEITIHIRLQLEPL